MSRQSSLGNKVSDLVGNLSYNFNEFNKVGYKFNLNIAGPISKSHQQKLLYLKYGVKYFFLIDLDGFQ